MQYRWGVVALGVVALGVVAGKEEEETKEAQNRLI